MRTSLGLIKRSCNYHGSPNTLVHSVSSSTNQSMSACPHTNCAQEQTTKYHDARLATLTLFMQSCSPHGLEEEPGRTCILRQRREERRPLFRLWLIWLFLLLLLWVLFFLRLLRQIYPSTATLNREIILTATAVNSKKSVITYLYIFAH